MKTTSRILAAVLGMVLVVCLSACGSGLSEAEIRSTFAALIDDSLALNIVYFGEGLPSIADDDEAVNSWYLPVSDDAPFQTEAEIRAATKAVFTTDLCEHLFTLGFTGMSVEDDDGERQTVTFARYIEQDGMLTVRTDLDEDAINVHRTYDYESMTILIDEGDCIIASFPTFLDGEPSVSVKVTIKKTPDGWRLDSPTY